jgi:hypothetical protein
LGRKDELWACPVPYVVVLTFNFAVLFAMAWSLQFPGIGRLQIAPSGQRKTTFSSRHLSKVKEYDLSMKIRFIFLERMVVRSDSVETK